MKMNEEMNGWIEKLGSRELVDLGSHNNISFFQLPYGLDEMRYRPL